VSDLIQRRTFCQAAAASALALALPAARASDFPSRPIRLVVGFAPGGPTDVIAREFARRFEREIGQPVIVDNKPGAAQSVAMSTTASSGADGYTLIMGSPSSHSVGPQLYKVQYDPRQFVPIAPLTTQANLLVALPSFPASSFKELVEYAKTLKKPLNYGSLGAGSSVHLATEMFKKRSGLEAQHIAYRGEAPALLALKGQEIELGAITMFGALHRIRNGELKAIGVFQAKPDPNLPQAQTTAQAGYPEVDLPSWLGVFAPPKTPKEVADKLEAAARKVKTSADFAAYLATIGNSPLMLSNPAFVSMIQKQTQQLGEIIKALDLKPE
jgi:tripartite-type tricarboxylate transporter receptor subunit TctC